MRPWVVLALAGCNQVYGLDSTTIVDAAPDADERPDLDHDGIADVEDPCLNSEADRMADSDLDGVLDGVDNCVFIANDGDADGDGVPNACDPYPMLAGDRVRCSTTFQSRELSAMIWRPRSGEIELLAATGGLIALQEGSGVATNVLGSAPAIVVDVGWTTAYAQFPFKTGVWLDAQSSPSGSDVACMLGSNGTRLRLELAGAVSADGPIPRVDVDKSYAANVGFRAYLQPATTGTNVTCYVVYASPTNAQELLEVRGHIDAPLDTFGFVTREGVTTVLGLSIFERSAAPPLP